MDKSTISGIFLAVGGILAGLLLEGGKISQILQPTAAMIVLGGTVGAVMVQFPLSLVVQAFKQLALVIFDKSKNPKFLVETLVGFAHRARKNGILSLDGELAGIKDPFLQKALMLAVDGIEPDELRKVMELELDNQAEHAEEIAHVFEAAGGFAPTIGIIGAVLGLIRPQTRPVHVFHGDEQAAVLGLIQVMQHLSSIDEVGKGIAVAFVATIYGVGSANLFFLPSAGKLKIKGRQEQVFREMTVEGVVSILEGMNTRILETKLLGYLSQQQQSGALSA